MNNLFSEITIKNLKIKNRIVMPPIVIFDYAKEDGLVAEEHIKHYEERAKGGVGLIILEATCINKTGKLANKQLGIWSDEFIEGLSKIVDACHKHGSKILMQIHHAGLNTPKTVSNDIVAPSDCETISWVDNGTVSARALTIDEIHSLQKDYVAAAVRAKKAGFDGIELHGAHKYLISQFFSPLVNKRDDLYGGSLVNRARFATEIIGEIRKANGDNFIIGCRMGGNEPNLETSIELAKLLEQSGVDLLHVSFGAISPFEISPEDSPKVPADFNYNWIVYNGTEIKKNVNIPVIVVNSIRKPEEASYLIENGLADFTGIARGLLVDEEWANKAETNGNIAFCLGCKVCVWFRSGKSCPGVKLKNKIS